MSISSWRSIGRPNKSYWQRHHGMPMYRLQMVATTRTISWPMRGSTEWMLRSILLRISMISSSTTTFVSISPPSLSWLTFLGESMWKMTKNLRAFMASSISQLERFIWIQSKPSVLFANATHSKVATMTVGKTKKKSLRPLSKSWPLPRS